MPIQESVNRNSLQLSRLVIVLFVSAILLMTPRLTVASAAQNGPREEDLVIYFYNSSGSAYTALTSGDIDLILYDLTSSQADDAFANPNIVTAKVPDSGFYSFDLNNNYSIPEYPGIRSPMNYTAMRQVVAFLSDKDFYVNTLLGKKALRIDQPIAAPYYGWANASMSYPNYPYEYSPAGAKAVLDGKFPVGTTPNPYYDAGNPLSSAYLREYPADHPQKAGQDLDPLIFYVRSEQNARLQSGRAVYQTLQKMGVPIDATEAPSAVTYTPVYGEFNYHFYTGGMSVGSIVPWSLYNLYHTANTYPYGGNYVTGVRPGVPTHPKLDWLLERAVNAPTHVEAVLYTKLAVGYMTEICVNVPLWSVASYWGWSNKLLGVVNMQGGGPENEYSFMNAYKTDGSAIRCGTIGLPFSMNIIDSDWLYDYNNLDRIRLYGGVDFPAYNAASDQGCFVRDWETTTWNDAGTIKTKVAMTFRSDGYFVKPASGDQGRNVNATHYFLSSLYHYQIGWTWDSGNFVDLHHINITSSHSFEIYFDTYSYWNTYWCQSTILPLDVLAEYPEIATKHTENITSPTTPGDITLLQKPFWIEYATFNGTLLTPFRDYNIVKGKLHLYSNLGAGGLEVKYWAPGDPRGFTAGNLPWQIALEGAGMYYCTSLIPGEGGSATYKRNPYYWMETPLLGEIDFARALIDSKPIGPHKIDIFDIVLAAGAYGSQGTAAPSDNWLPAVDVASPVGRIDIFDIVTIAFNYGKEFDPPE